MDNVILLSQHLIKIILKKDRGNYNNNGNWIEDIKKQEIEGAIFPLNANDFRNYPAGLLQHDDIKLLTTEQIENTDKIVFENKEYWIVSSKKYSYLADMNFYILRRTLNDRDNKELN